MGGGMLSGLGLGLVVSALVLAVLSLSTPLPERSGASGAPAATSPVEAEAAADPAPDPVAPTGDADAGYAAGETAMPAAQAEAGAVSVEEAPQDDAPPAEPSAAVPAPAPEAEPEPEASTGEAESGPQQAAALAVDTGRPATPGPSDAVAEPCVTLPRIETSPATPGPGAPPPDDAAAQSPPSAETAPAPTPEVASLPAQPGPVVVPVAPSPQFIASAETATTGTAPRRLALPQSSDGPATTDTAPAPQPESAAAAPAPVTPRRVTLPQASPAEPETATEAEAPAPRRIVLPQVTQGDAAAPAPDTGRDLPHVAPAPAPAPEVAETPAPAAPDALRDNAVAFDSPAAGPMMAVVLIDDPDSPLSPDLLTRFTFPVSFAIDPLRPEAAARAAELRAAGFEVVILGGGLIPEGATPADVETALAGARETLPQAVALMDTPDSRIQGDRPVLDATVGALAESGHGLLAFPRGLNAAEQSALRLGVPAATIFRLLDDEDQRATVIARYLGRAGFAAGQDGAVVVVGRTRPDTVTALFSWALGGRSEQVALAPVSAVLLRLAE